MTAHSIPFIQSLQRSHGPLIRRSSAPSLLRMNRASATSCHDFDYGVRIHELFNSTELRKQRGLGCVISRRHRLWPRGNFKPPIAHSLSELCTNVA